MSDSEKAGRAFRAASVAFALLSAFVGILFGGMAVCVWLLGPVLGGAVWLALFIFSLLWIAALFDEARSEKPTPHGDHQ